MELQEFINYYNGRYCDFDKNGRFWCVDLMRQYLVEVLGISGWSLLAVTYAHQIFDNFPDSGDGNFIKIYNQKDNYPIAGDILFYKKKIFNIVLITHVCLVANAGLNWVCAFDQNWPIGQPCKYVTHNYKNCIGWLRPIKNK
jgi:hypothetical protein